MFVARREAKDVYKPAHPTSAPASNTNWQLLSKIIAIAGFAVYFQCTITRLLS
jgi:hypothetical protein